MKSKLIDLTLRQIIEICNKNNEKCTECPLFNTYYDCHKFNSKYKTLTESYNIERLMKDEVELNE